MASKERPAELSGYSSSRVRWLDYLETGVQPVPQRNASADRASVHVPVRKGRNHIHPLRAWAILAFIAASLGGAIAELYLQWRYGA
jgi:hypothetical protein